ncbi:condensin complex subunit 2/barren [Phascolomyces articulosus]|uniref:Condensin complex subunit 2 n=1 Tax=Phascolomyces articulosus TaxID=60185 RepID=A0AAD5KA60_9FUNG|nr:condensin complex subunit 2/barren [Phascolomyces articulosus]
MTRSPLKSTNHRQRNDRPSQRNKNTLQRERLAKQVMRRQQGNSIESDTSSAAESSQATSSPSITAMPAVEVPAAASLTPEQMYSNFEEWIKMCTDNKVNANNTWNFALIDYFHEMTFLRDGDTINFQKASCTLDGCVKIYTSRVDSVATETGKLLSGLADSAAGDDDDDDAHRSGDAPERRTRRRGNRAESTLLKDFSSIALKKFDLDFAVDPLFKKTSADFDEGGARGLLLNHLTIDRDCKIIFDASDASSAGPVPDKQQPPLSTEEEKMDHEKDENEEEQEGQKKKDDEEEEEESKEKKDDQEETESSEKEKEDDQETTDKAAVTEEGDLMDIDATNDTITNEAKTNNDESQQTNEQEVETTKDQQPVKEEKDSLVEISRLRARAPSAEIIGALQICPTLHGYNFFSDADSSMPDLENAAEQLENPVDTTTKAATITNASSNDIEPSSMDYNPEPDYDGMDDFFDYGEDAPLMDGINDVPFGEGNEEGVDGTGAEAGQEEDEQGRLNENQNPLDTLDFMSAMTGGDGSNMFSYFDSTFGKNWAGPEHWKLRRPVSRAAQEKEAAQQEAGEADGAEKSRKKQRQAFQIDFIAGEDIDEDVLFATDKRTKISMSSVQESAAKEDNHLLPNDMHFSSKQLLKLFLKPTFSMRSKKNPVQPTEPAASVDQASATQEDDQQYDYDPGMDDYDVGPDTQYWADQQAENTPEEPNQTQADTQENTSALNTLEDPSYFQDSFYDAYDDLENSHLYGDVLITNHRLKKTKPLYVNYARTAKRVDVKKLKDNLWKALTVAKPDTPSPTPVQPNNDSVQGIQRFTDILQELRKMYTVKAMKDISVPFCFICLLHLANERNLTISRPTNDTEDPDYDPDDFVLGDEPMNENFLNEVTIIQNV